MAINDNVKRHCAAMLAGELGTKPGRSRQRANQNGGRLGRGRLATTTLAWAASFIVAACSDGASVSGGQTADVSLHNDDVAVSNDTVFFDSFDIEIPENRFDITTMHDQFEVGNDVIVTDSIEDTDVADTVISPTDTHESRDVEETSDGEVVARCAPATSCNDGNSCTLDDRCQEDGVSCAGIPYECDDGLGCTAELCDGNGGCVVSIAEFTCVIDGHCVLFGTPDPEYPCHTCIPELSQESYSPDDSASCDDDNPCTLTLCQDGSCNLVGPTSCDDANPCTADTCDPGLGCIYSNITDSCSDSSECTKDDVCNAGKCTGQSISCNDGVPCTVDGCDPQSGCENQPVDQKCDDSVTCTVHVCVPDFGCVGTTVVALCNDGDPCTTDACSSTKGCEHIQIDGCVPPEPCVDVNECNDGIACTIDSCDSQKGCLHVASATNCDDLDPCTTESCSVPDGGCVTAPASGAVCDDADPCTNTSQCEFGVCVGSGDICGCDPLVPSPAQKVISLQIGSAGMPGEGLDVDNNPNTCAPKDACSGGIDNALSFIAGLANSSLVEAVASGGLVFLIDYLPTPGDTTPQKLSLLTGAVSETTPGCDPLTTGCAFLVSSDSFDADTCNPLIFFDNATLTGTAVVAGGTNSQIQISIPLGDTAQLDLTLHGAKLAATATFSGGKLQTMTGLIGGALPKQTLLDALNAVPEESLPLPKSTVLGLIETAVVEDVDINSDGKPDGASMALKFSSIAAPVVGLSDTPP